MAHPKPSKDAKLIMAIFYADDKIYKETLKVLTGIFGKIDFESETYPFIFTDYYSEEMGKDLKKRIISFKELFNRKYLAETKLISNYIEDEFSIKDKRIINIDPGYLTEHNVILASAKEMPNRVYLNYGIYGDIILMYKDNKYMDHMFTFPEFKSDAVKSILIKIRDIFRNQIHKKKE